MTLAFPPSPEELKSKKPVQLKGKVKFIGKQRRYLKERDLPPLREVGFLFGFKMYPVHLPSPKVIFTPSYWLNGVYVSLLEAGLCLGPLVQILNCRLAEVRGAPQCSLLFVCYRYRETHTIRGKDI